MERISKKEIKSSASWGTTCQPEVSDDSFPASSDVVKQSCTLSRSAICVQCVFEGNKQTNTEFVGSMH